VFISENSPGRAKKKKNNQKTKQTKNKKERIPINCQAVRNSCLWAGICSSKPKISLCYAPMTVIPTHLELMIKMISLQPPEPSTGLGTLSPRSFT
jgi:hypothetical protein